MLILFLEEREVAMNTVSLPAAALVLFSAAWMNTAFADAGKYTSQLAEREAVQKGVDSLTQGSVD